MVWFKVDDNLAFHAKTVAAGNAAMGLWVRAGSWSAQNLTEGFIPDHMVTALGTDAQARRLVQVKLWHRQKTGFIFHEFLDRNPSKDAVESEREAARERQRRAREKARKSRSGTPVTELSRSESRRDMGVSHGPPDPTRPDPSLSVETFVVGGPSVTRGERPPAKCQRHINSSSDEPCRACGDARRAHDSWSKPTLSVKKTMCGDHPDQPALNCPKCAAEVSAAPPENWRKHA